MSLRNKIISVISITFVLLIGYESVRGRLFPISPVKIGFESQETGKAKLFYHPGASLADFENLEELMRDAEQFHRLTFRKPVRVIIGDSMEEYRRFTGSTAAAVALAYPGAICFSPRSEGRVVERLLRHELSHLLVYQHLSPLGVARFPGWFLEGLAVHYGNQDDYMSREQLKGRVKEGFFVYPQDYGTWVSNKVNGGKEYIEAMGEEHPDWAYSFIYAEFGFLIEDLVCDYGKDKVILLMKRLLRSQTPEEHFKDIFEISLEDYVSGFKKRFEE